MEVGFPLLAEGKLRPSVAVGLRLQLERYLLHSFPIRRTWALEAGPEPKMRRRRASRVVRQSAIRNERRTAQSKYCPALRRKVIEL